MSGVRMCDYMTENGPCGTIFSEKEKQWGHWYNHCYG